jgi:hypothetical protein
MKKILYIIFLFGFVIGQTIQINEIVSTNGTVLYDEDGDTPDWFELYNTSGQEINLNGYGITDDPSDLSMWVFPFIVLEPNGFLVIFASDKNRKDLVAEWDAVINWGDSWSYWPGTSAPILNWDDPGTDVSNWSTGPSGFGYGDNDDNTELSQIISVFARKTFQIDDSTMITKALFHIDYDDGYIAYLNGEEFSRRNMGEPNTQVYYNETTTGLHEAEIYSGGFPEEISIDLNEFPIVSGENTLAVEVHNYNTSSSDLSCIPFLTLGYNTEIDNATEPHQLMVLPSSYLHTNFKLSSNEDDLILSDQDENVIDSIFTGTLETDMSFGRYFESSSWVLFAEPTPGSTNSTSSYAGALSTIEFSMASGFYNQAQISVELSSPDESATIYFTTDGTTPTMDDFNYGYSIPLTSTTVIRARAFLNGWLPSETESKTYIFGEDEAEGLPVVFLSTDPSTFFDEDTGMYVMGPNASWDFPYFGANFWEDWERSIHFEILETDGSGYAANAGVKIFGGWSRAFPQKSLSIFSRSYYGPSTFDYDLFPDSGIESYEAFILRNSGNDWESTMLRDGFITSLTNNLNIDHQQYRPAVLYLNGEFWGIQNIREKVNEHFLASHHLINAENIDLLDIQGVNEENIVHGTNIDYVNLLDYLENQDMGDPIVQNALENWIDVESYMSYQAFQIFIDNRDWPGNNIKFWRDHRVGGKWRWILYDTDFGFSIWESNAYTYNTLSFALNPNGPGWPNPPWSTFLFRRMMDNDHFKNSFINIYCDLLNTVFQPNYLISHLDSIANNIEDIIPVHRARWYNNGNWPNSTVNWESRINTMENFSTNRRSYAINHIKNQFDLPNIAQTSLNIVPEGAGSIQLNTLKIIESSWNGYYFPTIPIEARAIPNEGFQFSSWLEFPDSNATIHVQVTDPFTLTAVFIPTNLSSGTTVINEINYNSSDDYNSDDWVELINPGETEIDISDWILKDDDNSHGYTIPDETVIQPNNYLVLAKDMDLFSSSYPDINNVIGPFDFSLSGGGDQVRIFDNAGVLIDSVKYDDGDPWPVEPDGNGPTLELINPTLDNLLYESWAASTDNGTPGAQNSTYNNLSSDLKSIIPEKIHLYPAYPNPFNPTTTISFDIPNTLAGTINALSLHVFNIKGQRVETLINETIKPGKHNIQWHPKNISSGVYFIRFKYGEEVITQKITFIK